MTDEDYKVWVARHASLFMMTGEADLALFAAWKPLVLPYNRDDFVEGSNYLAAENSAIFRTQHLDRIRQRIHARHRDEMQKRIEAEQAGQGESDCPTCLGAGVASVPHWEHAHEGVWQPPYPTHGIYCHCSLGQAKYNSLVRSIQDARETKNKNVWIPPEPLAWAKYEALVPNWAELLDWREDQQRAELRARGIARHADLAAPIKAITDRVRG